MEHDSTREDLLATGKKQPNNYGAKQPSGSLAHKKRRSHSRGNSITRMEEIIPVQTSIPSPPRSRPTSHHKRRSSVSTRRESAEVMGINMPEDSFRESNKTDMHLRALLALEGHTSNVSSPLTTSFGFSKVDLPDFGTDAERSDTAALSKPSFNANNSLAGKRDSFGKLLTPSSAGPKQELQTLLEEDEGDEFGNDPVVPVPAPRHRPRSLNLRSSLIRSSASLPTPSPTPAPRTPKLKSLALASGTVVSSPGANPRRQSALVTSTSSPLLSTQEVENTRIQRSISYHRTLDTEALLCLPTCSQTLTPTPSPTREHYRRSLSPTEFLAQSHTSLLVARIAELEGALSRTTSSSPASTEPSEELLEMLSDLKAERDQLKRSLDELTARYGDQEKEIATLNRRLDNEKRDAWLSKEKLSRAEAEKSELVKDNEVLNEELIALRQQLQTIRSQLAMEKDARHKVEQDLVALSETPKIPDYPYPTSYSHTRSADSEMTCSEGPCFSIEVRVPSPDENDRDSDGSFHSRSASSLSCSSGILSRQPSSISTPDDTSRQRDSLSSGWSFAKASRKVKHRQSVDHFFACLEDSDGGMRVEPVSSPSIKSTTGSYNIGFGLNPDEDEDPAFNFGQPSPPSPFPRSDESDAEEMISGPATRTTPAPFIDDEDSSFSFSTPGDYSTSPSSPGPSTSGTSATLSPPTSVSPVPPSPSPTIPNFAEPSTPRPRHKARDSMHLRRRSRLERASADLAGSSGNPSTPQSPKSPASSESASSFNLQRSSLWIGRSAPTLDVAIPSDDFSSWTLSFDVTTSPTEMQSSSSSASKPSRSSPPLLSSSRATQSAKSHNKSQPLPTPPPSTPSKSPLANLSFSALANLLPASWSPRTTPVQSPTSSMGRTSFDRACASRERQLNRLRSEVIEQFGSSSQTSHEHMRNSSGPYAL